MFDPKRFFIVVALTCATAGFAFSQTKSLSELETAIRSFENLELFSVKYDDKKDATVLNLSFDLRLEEPKLQKEFKEFGLELSSIYTGIGIDAKPYRTVVCTNSRGKKFYFASNRQLKVSLDYQEFTLAEGQRTTEVRRGKVFENLCWDIDQELVRDFGLVETMILTIGNIQIPISSGKIAAFRNYSKLLVFEEIE